MNTTFAEELNQENMNEFELDMFTAIAKVNNDGKRTYSKSIFKYIKSIIKYENVTLNFRNDHIFALLDDEIIINKKRSGEDFLYLTQKPLRLLASKLMDSSPTS